MAANVIVRQSCLAQAWFVKYPLDAYALGPYRYDKYVSAAIAAGQAKESFGEYPADVWPDGQIKSCEEYDVILRDPDAIEDPENLIDDIDDDDIDDDWDDDDDDDDWDDDDDDDDDWDEDDDEDYL